MKSNVALIVYDTLIYIVHTKRKIFGFYDWYHENKLWKKWRKNARQNKMILQKHENLVYIQQQYIVSFWEKIDSKSGFF